MRGVDHTVFLAGPCTAGTSLRDHAKVACNALCFSFPSLHCSHNDLWCLPWWPCGFLISLFHPFIVTVLSLADLLLLPSLAWAASWASLLHSRTVFSEIAAALFMRSLTSSLSLATLETFSPLDSLPWGHCSDCNKSSCSPPLSLSWQLVRH